jgi:hypothetical protein
MLMTQDSNLFLSVGKQVKDEYGRTIGRIASFAVNPSGRLDFIYVEQGDGKFIKYPVDNIKIEGADAIFLSKIKMGIEALCNQIPLIWRKDQALKELVEKKKVSPEVYEDVHNSFEGALNQLKGEAQALVERIDKETARCAQEIKELNYALVHLEIEHEIGKVDEQSYQTAFATIQECLKKANVEKSDLEAMKNKLSNILLGEKSPQTEQETKEEAVEESTAQEVPTAPSSSLPEPPVVVYVKELGESSI